jgi:hypothetical protein
LAVGAISFSGPAGAQNPPAANATQGVVVAELTPTAEQSIRKGLEWLAANQNPDGSWGTDHRVASTSLSLMAFMVKGHFPDQRPPYGDKLAKGLDFLMQQQKPERPGYLGASMYEHGLATLALSEAWGMSQREAVGDSVKAAVGLILRSQNPAGGWRYQPDPTDADLSVTVMQVVALSSAKEAGIVVPDKVIEKAVQYVLSCHDRKTGGFCYQPGSGPGFARTAAGVMSLTMCGRRGSEEVKAGLDYLANATNETFESADGQFFYAHYYAAQDMFQAGDQRYRQWYPRIRESLLKKQLDNGSWADGNGIGTQMAVLILGIPYRYLPIYQR